MGWAKCLSWVKEKRNRDAEMVKAQTDIGVSDKLQLFLRKRQFLLDNKTACALGLYKKTPSWLRGKHGRHCSRCVRFWLTLNLWGLVWLHAKFIQNKTRQNQRLFWKISLILLFFCFQLRPSNPLGLRGNWTCWFQKLLSSFDIPNTPPRK